MGRTSKHGLDYFPLDTEWDIKMQLVKARFGLVGVGCMVELFKMIYHEGYALKWDDDTRLLFSASNHIDEDTLDKIVMYSIEKGLFHPGIFSALHVLTSSGIQKRWLKIVRDSKRAVNEIDRDLDVNTARWFTPEEIEKTPEEMPSLCEYTPEEIPQSKVKEIKEKESKGKENTSAAATPCAVVETAQAVPTKAVAKPGASPLYHAIRQSFLSKTPTFANYAKEAQAIKRVEAFAGRYAPEDQVNAARMLIEKYYQLTESSDKFWHKQPFTPSGLSCLMDRVARELEISRPMTREEAEAAYQQANEIPF